MRRRSVSLWAVLAMMAAAALAQTAVRSKPAPDVTPIVGVWRAQMDGLPYVALVVTDESGSLLGAIQFYMIHRPEGQPATATPGLPEPMFNLQFDGKTLTFQVSHRRAHPPGSLKDPPVTFQLTLTGADKGQAKVLSDASSVLTMVRSEY
jgi:hypothetical protein